MKGILGKKLGMTQVFTPEGNVVPVTVIEAGPCVVLQRKTSRTTVMKLSKSAMLIKRKRSTKPEVGHAKKANTTPKRYVKELRGVDLSQFEVGQEAKADIFAER